MSQRLNDLIRLYSILASLEQKTGGSQQLANCSGRMAWPQRGVYFFREQGGDRTESGKGPRIVRVGTHALKPASSTKLWGRLAQHKGFADGGGNHRVSIFRLIVGTALITRDGLNCPTWGEGNTAKKEVRDGELTLEREVSSVICAMPFLWLNIDDEPGPESKRGYIERNAIALLSNYKKPGIDTPSSKWLGRYCNRQRVRESGLWNSNHVDESYDRGFLDELDTITAAMPVVT